MPAPRTHPQATGSPLPGSTGPANPFMAASTAAEIQRINERITLLQAQLNELDLQAKVTSKRKEIQSVSSGGAESSPFDGKGGVPSVLSVAGLQGRLEAVLVFPGGIIQRVKAGDVIGQRRVVRLSLNEVVLTDLQGRRVQRLAFGSAPPVRENGTAPGAAPAPPTSASPVLGR